MAKTANKNSSNKRCPSKKQIKSAAKTAINKLFASSKKKLIADINKVLNDFDLWYGDSCCLDKVINARNFSDRNADQLVEDGEFESTSDAYDWLNARDEVKEAFPGSKL